MNCSIRPQRRFRVHLKVSRWWSNRSKAGLLVGSVVLAASVAAAWADAIEVLQGAWVLQVSNCTAVFEEAGNKVQFKDRNYALDSGFIISGNKATGPMGGCTISQVDEDNEGFSALLTCSDALLTKKLSMSFRIVDATHFERLDPETPDRPRRYKKCVFD